MASVACELCGGTDFYKLAGFYYCNECQTQTQELQEHVFDKEDAVAITEVKKTKRSSRKSSKPKEEERITSWECYNYIAVGLVNELIQLGADESLRTTVEVLWLKYLKDIQVIRKGNKPPKLPAVNSTRDAEIIFGRKHPKKRARSRSKSPASTTDVSTLDADSIKRARTKERRVFTQSFLSTSQQTDVSIANQSLSSLKSSESKKKEPEKYIQYNRKAREQLKKHMKKKHLKRHCQDVDCELDCHKKITKRMVSSTYYQDASNITRTKLYSLIYIGLLINKDKFQLSDMLRFIREGNLSYQHVDHFFPEELVEKKLNVCSFTTGTSFMTHYSVRMYGAKMVELLNVANVIPVPNMEELCVRYCKELNLPDQICEFTLNILSRALPKMNMAAKTKAIPNYEGRAISFIIFVLKLLFGLDDETEFEHSKLARNINKSSKKSFTQWMFSFKQWLSHIEYRRLIITQYHFPSSYADNLTDTEAFVNFLNGYNRRYNSDVDIHPDIEVFSTLLRKIENCFDPIKPSLSFNPSLKPYSDYVQEYLSNNENPCIRDLLNVDCSKMSVDFLLYGELYLQKIYPGCEISYKHGGKNDNINLMYLFDSASERVKESKRRKQTHNVTLLADDDKRTIFDNKITEKGKIKTKPDSEDLLEVFTKQNEEAYKKNARKRSKLLSKAKLNLSFKQNDENKMKYVLYDPSERFIVNLQNVSDYSEEIFAEHFGKLSFSFRAILKECARITEQTIKEVYSEYVVVETYLTCVADIKQGKMFDEKIVNANLKKNVNLVKKVW